MRGDAGGTAAADSGARPTKESGLPVALVNGLRRVAAADRLLVVSDFDGTLAAIADRPDAVVPDAQAVAALHALADLPSTWTAVLSGRSLAVLERHLGAAGAITLVGSHGAEFGEDAAPDSTTVRTLDDVTARLHELAESYEGSLVERKPEGVAFHVRRVDADRRTEAAERAAALAGRYDGLRVQPGHMVVEMVSGDANKGDAIDALRRSVGPAATVYVGDDRTDEHAFARLGPADLAVKIGPGSTWAPIRIDSQSMVAPLFQRLLALRASAVA